MAKVTTIKFYLQDAATKVRTGPFDISALENKLLATPEENLVYCYVWRTGWSEWMPSIEYKRSMASNNVVENQDTQPEQPPAPVQVESATNISEIAKNRRTQVRIQERFRCIIRNENIIFRTFTKDISLSGIALEDAIPTHLFNHNCQVIIADLNRKENVRFTLKVTSRNDLKYFALEQLEPKYQLKLSQWLEELLLKAS